LIGRKPVNLIFGWCGRFLFSVVPRQFSQELASGQKIKLVRNICKFHCDSKKKRSNRTISGEHPAESERTALGKVVHFKPHSGRHSNAPCRRFLVTCCLSLCPLRASLPRSHLSPAPPSAVAGTGSVDQPNGFARWYPLSQVGSLCSSSLCFHQRMVGTTRRHTEPQHLAQSEEAGERAKRRGAFFPLQRGPRRQSHGTRRGEL